MSTSTPLQPLGRSLLSSRAWERHDDDDLALRAPLFHIRHRIERLVESERAVEYRTQRARIIESGQRLQLLAIGPHKEERVAHAQLPGLRPDLAAHQYHHRLQEWSADLLGERGVRRADNTDRQAARFEHVQRLREVVTTKGVEHDVVAGE